MANTINTPTTHSEALYHRAQQVLPGGASRNTVLRKPHPLYAVSADGCWVTDAEGSRRIDFANNMASLIHGHAHPRIVEAVTKQLQIGTAFTMATEAEVRYAEHICSRNEGFEQVRFMNSGTEAVMAGLKASRAFTGRSKIAKVEGAYHGGYDFAEVSQTAKPENWGAIDSPNSVPVATGTPAGVLEDVVVIPFNDTDTALSILNEHRGELACVLLDLMPHRIGLVPANDDFVQALRTWTKDDNALLLCDEVITFRGTYGGAQRNYNVRADLTTMGKMIGGGFPVGALAGSTEVMSVMNPDIKPLLLPQSGTFSANPVTMTAGLTAMELFDHAAITRLNQLNKTAIEAMRDVIASSGFEASVTGDGSMFRIHMSEESPNNYRQGYPDADRSKRHSYFLDELLEQGVLLTYSAAGFLSTAMGESEIEYLVRAVDRALTVAEQQTTDGRS